MDVLAENMLLHFLHFRHPWRSYVAGGHDCMDLGTPLRGVQDDSKDGGGRAVSGTTAEVERLRRQSRGGRVPTVGALGDAGTFTWM
jgi:hypothetical protein